MKVDVRGFGPIKFPDTMTDAEVREVLRQFEPKKDDTIEKLTASIEKMAKNQQIVTNTIPVQVEKQVIIKEPKVIEVERMVPIKPVSWHFTIEREDGLISEVYAEPIE
jgi:hypothetical protein